MVVVWKRAHISVRPTSLSWCWGNNQLGESLSWSKVFAARYFVKCAFPCLRVSATERNPVDAQLTFFSSDTNVQYLITANYDRLQKNTSISMASSVQQIEPLWAALGPNRAKALPGLHAFSGADNIGRFARIGKPTCFKLFVEAEDDVIEALWTHCDDVDVCENLQLTLAQFVCTAYRPKGTHALKHFRVALAPVLQIHGRKWKAAA